MRACILPFAGRERLQIREPPLRCHTLKPRIASPIGQNTMKPRTIATISNSVQRLAAVPAPTRACPLVQHRILAPRYEPPTAPSTVLMKSLHDKRARRNLRAMLAHLSHWARRSAAARRLPQITSQSCQCPDLFVNGKMARDLATAAKAAARRWRDVTASRPRKWAPPRVGAALGWAWFRAPARASGRRASPASFGAASMSARV